MVAHFQSSGWTSVAFYTSTTLLGYYLMGYMFICIVMINFQKQTGESLLLEDLCDLAASLYAAREKRRSHWAAGRRKIRHAAALLTGPVSLSTLGIGTKPGAVHPSSLVQSFMPGAAKGAPPQPQQAGGGALEKASFAVLSEASPAGDVHKGDGQGGEGKADAGGEAHAGGEGGEQTLDLEPPHWVQKGEDAAFESSLHRTLWQFAGAAMKRENDEKRVRAQKRAAASAALNDASWETQSGELGAARRAAQSVVTHQFFGATIFLVVLVDCIGIGMERPGLPAGQKHVLQVMDLACEGRAE